MRTNRTPDEWADWCIAKNRIAEELKGYYQACTTGQLPPQLLTLSKKLDEELLKKARKTIITTEQLEAILKAVDEGGDGDDESSEGEVIAILPDHAPGEIPLF